MFDEVLYVVPFGRKTQERRISDTIVYRELEFPRSGVGWRKLIAGLRHVMAARRFLDDAVEVFSPDVVQTVGPHYTAAMALLAGKVHALPTVCMIEAYWEDILPFQQYFPKSVKAVLPYWYRIVYRLFARYKGAPSLAPEYYTSKGMDGTRIAPWIQPLDLREVKGADAADAPEGVKASAHPRIVVLGRLHPEKLAVDAFEIFAKAVASDLPGTLIFVGDGLDRPIIEARAKELGLSDRLVITGLIPHKQAMSVLKACDLSIAPMQGSALLETLAAGIATVAYNHETHAALITSGENGVLVTHRDIEAASKVLKQWLAHPVEAKAIGDKARHRVEQKYNVTAMRDLLMKPFIDAYNLPKYRTRRGAEHRS
jgi:glycosyltransferase involved in cell wall biosynthesis